ncbi:MAG: histidinol-phosphate aminotransferase [Bradymonadia bacterium]|jgi:histidinol-phosphate aminotransferase
MPETTSPAWVHQLRPYVPGKPTDELKRELGIERVVKLASNENPLGPSPHAVEAMVAASRNVHRYPDPACFDLKSRLAAFAGVESSRIVVGNGSNEVITLLIRAFCTREQNVVASQYGFIAYKVVCGAAGVPFREASANGLGTDVDALIAQCDENTQILFIANPNNPTGTYARREEILRLLKETPEHVLVVLDEAYTEYVTASDCPDGLTLLGERENLVVMRTFSKAYGLAGCRVGWAACPAFVADRVNRVREPFNANHVGQAGALAAMDDAEFMAKVVELNTREMARLCRGIEDAGFSYVPSQGNFVLMATPDGGAPLYDALLKEGVIVRPLAGYGLPNHLRVTVGTESENQTFLDALTKISR